MLPVQVAMLREPVPLVWFSRQQEWECSVIKGLCNPRTSETLEGMPRLEAYGCGLFRFGIVPSLAPLRWYDYLLLNPTPKAAARTMAQVGYPPDWLASRRPIPLS